MSFQEKYNRAQAAKQQSLDTLKATKRKALEPIEETLRTLGERTAIPKILQDAAKTLNGQAWMMFMHDFLDTQRISIQVDDKTESILAPDSIGYLLCWEENYICLEITKSGDVYFLKMGDLAKEMDDNIFYHFASFSCLSSISLERCGESSYWPPILRSQWESNPTLIEDAIVNAVMNPCYGKAHSLPHHLEYMLEKISDL
jgi:hypothetical protein